nr:hypothetical protein [Tanacetum cinerariifolium]
MYDQEPTMVAEDDEITANQDNSPRINRSTGYDNQRIVNVDVARENVEVTPDVADNSGPFFDTEPLQKIPNNHSYNVSAIESEHPEEQVYQDDDDHDLANECDFLASLIKKLKCEIDDRKNRNNFLETSNKALVEKLKETFHLCLKEEMVADLRYFNSLELEVDSLKSQLKTQKTQSLNEINRLSREYYYADHINAILGMYKLHTKLIQTRTTQVPHDIRKTNKHVSFSTRVIPPTSVSRLQLKSNQMEDRVMLNNSQGKKQEVEDYRRIVKFSNNKTSVTACNDSLNAKTMNVNFVCVTCGKCVLNDNHDKCVLHYLNGMNSRTKMSMAVPISTREPKRTVNQSIATPLRRTVASESANQKPRHTTRKLYEHVTKTCSWWYPKFTPPGYKWKPKSQIGNINPNLVEIILFIVDSGCSKHMTENLKILTNFVEKFLVTVKFGSDQIAPILGYRDLVQGPVTIKRVYYVEGLNHNLFSVGQFCDADLDVAFRKSTCFIRDLKGNDLLIASRGTDLYSITLQDTSFPNPICLMAKATSSQAWLWHHRLSHLNFDTINITPPFSGQHSGAHMGVIS